MYLLTSRKMLIYGDFQQKKFNRNFIKTYNYQCIYQYIAIFSCDIVARKWTMMPA